MQRVMQHAQQAIKNSIAWIMDRWNVSEGTLIDVQIEEDNEFDELSEIVHDMN